MTNRTNQTFAFMTGVNACGFLYCLIAYLATGANAAAWIASLNRIGFVWGISVLKRADKQS